jgi:hypothetical protein
MAKSIANKVAADVANAKKQRAQKQYDRLIERAAKADPENEKLFLAQAAVLAKDL